MQDYIDINKCAECQGKCCKSIYLIDLEGGIRPHTLSMDEWIEQWEKEFINSGAADLNIKPVFNPIIVHNYNGEFDRKMMEKKGINTFACKYLGKNGCLLPRLNRPSICNSYDCDISKWNPKK